MPPRARLRLTPIVQLERQLEFAGAEAVCRIVKAAEAATREVDRDGLLSEAWIVERLTGVKSRDAERAPVLVGQAVAMDLSALALRLSERAPLQPSDLPGGAVTLVHAADDLGVTVRSLQRWRRQGLAMVRVRTPAGVRTALSGKALAWCRERLLGSVASRRRDPVRRASVMAVAATEARAGETLHAVARRVAKKAGVSVASARRMIAAAERKGVVPTLRRRETVQPSARRAAWRAWRRGTELLPVAQSIARSEAATLRLVRRERRDRLRALRLGASPLATFTRADAADTLLAPRAVRSGLAVEPWPVEARAFLRRFPPAAQGERASPADAQRLVALRYLLWNAALEMGCATAPDLDRACAAGCAGSTAIHAGRSVAGSSAGGAAARDRGCGARGRHRGGRGDGGRAVDRASALGGAGWRSGGAIARRRCVAAAGHGRSRCGGVASRESS